MKLYSRTEDWLRIEFIGKMSSKKTGHLSLRSDLSQIRPILPSYEQVWLSHVVSKGPNRPVFSGEFSESWPVFLSLSCEFD